jgi:hypothetical protein
MKIKVTVTKEILKRSMMCGVGNKDWSCVTEESFKNKVGVGFNCAIGEAVNELLPGAWVSPSAIRIYKSHEQMLRGGEIHEIDLPTEAIAFIPRFDALKSNPEARLELPELSFEIELPEGLINEIGISQAYKILSESKTLELIQA